MEKGQKILNWLNKEKLRDNKEIEDTKLKIIKEFKGLKKEDMFPKPKKLSLWQRMKIILFGN